MPAAVLEELQNTIIELKVTLSYFIDPNPGFSANVDHSDTNPLGSASICSAELDPNLQAYDDIVGHSVDAIGSKEPDQ